MTLLTSAGSDVMSQDRVINKLIASSVTIQRRLKRPNNIDVLFDTSLEVLVLSVQDLDLVQVNGVTWRFNMNVLGDFQRGRSRASMFLKPSLYRTLSSSNVKFLKLSLKVFPWQGISYTTPVRFFLSVILNHLCSLTFIRL